RRADAVCVLPPPCRRARADARDGHPRPRGRRQRGSRPAHARRADRAMTAFALRNLFARRRRLAGTFLAVFLGVSFLAGALVLGSTLARNFDSLFSDANAGTDAAVRSSIGKSSVDGTDR